MKEIYFLLLVVIVLTISANPLLSQKKQSECERKIQELEERIINLEKMNSDLVNLLSIQNAKSHSVKEKDFVIQFSFNSDNGNLIDKNSIVPNYIDGNLTDEFSSDIYVKYKKYFEEIKVDMDLPYLLVKKSIDRKINFTDHSSLGGTKYDYSETIFGELGYFLNIKEAKEFIANYIPKEMETVINSLQE